MTARPFYSFPLDRLSEILRPIALAVRTLPAAQIADEIEQLSAVCSEPGEHFAEHLMRQIYETEIARRNAPDRRFDDELAAALSRLERQTSAEDRHLVREIGSKLFRIGGREALTAAYRRMIEASPPKRREVRKKIIQRRWAGIVPPIAPAG